MRAYQDMVFSTAARLTGNPAQAEDITQEVFLKAYSSFERLRESPTAGGWLKTVATNLALNHLTRYRRRWRLFSEVRTEDAGEREIESAAAVFDELAAEGEAEQRASLVEDALQRLPEHQRVPLVLFHFEEMPYQDIAARLGVSLAKVKTDILRGRLAMAKLLAKSGLEPPAARSGAAS
jgi:RNA polymerase sigma-70 factor (ECF subfamily)